MSLFRKLVDETQISKPPEPAMSHNSMKLMVFQPFIAIYFRSKHYETLCSIKIEQIKKKNTLKIVLDEQVCHLSENTFLNLVSYSICSFR